MCIRGRDYREDHDFEMFGETVTVRFKPLLDPDFIPLVAFLKKHLQVDVGEDAVEATREEVEAARDESGSIDLDRLDGELVNTLRAAIVKGVAGALDRDGNYVEHTEDDNLALSFVGGHSIEIAMHALEVSGNVRDATEFRGSRGGQRGFGPE
jgi:hypothetical protein